MREKHKNHLQLCFIWSFEFYLWIKNTIKNEMKHCKPWINQKIRTAASSNKFCLEYFQYD
eukprot:UN15440